MIEEEEYIEEDGYLEEEEIISNDDDSDGKICKRSSSKSRSNGGPMSVKRTRVFRIARGMERQRGEKEHFAIYSKWTASETGYDPRRVLKKRAHSDTSAERRSWKELFC